MEKDQIENTNERPQAFKVTAILSFIYTIGNGLLYLVGLVNGRPGEDAIMEQRTNSLKSINEFKELGQDGFADLLTKIQYFSDYRLEHFYTVLPIDFAVIILGGISVFLMWKGIAKGFQLYVLYSVVSVLYYFFFLSFKDVPMGLVYFNMFISAIFILIYYRNRSWLK